MQLFRWVMVVPAGVLSWYVALFAGVMAASALDHFCPADQMESGMCIAWWHRYAVDTIVIVFAAIAAFLVVLCATLAAPSHKLKVAWVAFSSGCVFALYAVSQTKAVAAFIAAVLSGLVAVFCVARNLGVSMLFKNSLKSDTSEPRNSD